MATDCTDCTDIIGSLSMNLVAKGASRKDAKRRCKGMNPIDYDYEDDDENDSTQRFMVPMRVKKTSGLTTDH